MKAKKMIAKLLLLVVSVFAVAIGCKSSNPASPVSSSSTSAPSREVVSPTSQTEQSRSVRPQASRVHVVHHPLGGGTGPQNRGFNWQERGPLDFLDFLASKFSDDSPSLPGTTSLIVRGTHRGWIRESDIPALMDLLDSKKQCLAVVMSLSSALAWEPSTVGNEAANLILGFRSEVDQTGYAGYPARLVSTRYPIDRDELRRWWRDYRDRSIDEKPTGH